MNLKAVVATPEPAGEAKRVVGDKIIANVTRAGSSRGPGWSAG